MMKKIIFTAVMLVATLAGCSSVPMESKENEAKAKEFNAPAPNNAGIYVFRRDTFVGAALKKDIWVEKECVGESAKGVFFYTEVPADKKIEVATESEFSPNVLTVDAKNGNLYFFEQFIKLGAFVGGADLKAVSEIEGKAEVSRLGMAKNGKCSSKL